MKIRSLISLVFAGIGFISTNSYALVIEDASCKARGIEVTIMDNQGIGPVRTSRPTATVMDGNGKVIFSARVHVQGTGWIADDGGATEFQLRQGFAQPLTPHPGLKGPFFLTLNAGAIKLANDAVNCTVFNEF
jgi:hypothetical protein